MAQILILVVMFGLLWAVLIRPQKAKQQKQQQLLSNIEPGDEILTVGGLFGIVQSIDEDDELITEIAEGVHVRDRPARDRAVVVKAERTRTRPRPRRTTRPTALLEAGDGGRQPRRNKRRRGNPRRSRRDPGRQPPLSPRGSPASHLTLP